MSRIGKQPVAVPAGVTVQETAERELRVKGPRGELSLRLRPEVTVELDGATLHVRPVDGADTRQKRAYHGMTRALVRNMVAGVSQGFQKGLEIVGVGWNASVDGRTVVLNLGYANPVRLPIPDGVEVQTPSPTSIVVSGADKQAVGQLAATIRKSRPPEPYKGKGVRYQGEYVKQKAGKTFGS